jgi:hypothetical protein
MVMKPNFETLVSALMVGVAAFLLGLLVAVHSIFPDMRTEAPVMFEEELYRGVELPAGWEYIDGENLIHHDGDTLRIIKTTKNSYHFVRH